LVTLLLEIVLEEEVLFDAAVVVVIVSIFCCTKKRNCIQQFRAAILFCSCGIISPNSSGSIETARSSRAIDSMIVPLGKKMMI
jgi:hypothetical protein